MGWVKSHKNVAALSTLVKRSNLFWVQSHCLEFIKSKLYYVTQEAGMCIKQIEDSDHWCSLVTEI